MTVTFRKLLPLVLGLLLVAFSPRASATPTHCASLSPEQQRIKQIMFQALHPYSHCDQTFARCLAQKNPHPVVLRQANEVCRQIKEGKKQTDVERILGKRADSLVGVQKAATFALDKNTLAGDPQAPIQVVVYACARCPFCAQLVPELYREVTTGSLKGKVQLYFRPFPLKGHVGSLEGGLAMVGAAHLEKFWPFTLKLYAEFDHFCPQLLPEWASSPEIGMDRKAFDDECATAVTRQSLSSSKQEGIRNKVDATPAIFINGRKYVAELRMPVIADLLEEAYESLPPSTSAK